MTKSKLSNQEFENILKEADAKIMEQSDLELKTFLEERIKNNEPIILHDYNGQELDRDEIELCIKDYTPSLVFLSPIIMTIITENKKNKTLEEIKNHFTNLKVEHKDNPQNLKFIEEQLTMSIELENRKLTVMADSLTPKIVEDIFCKAMNKMYSNLLMNQEALVSFDSEYNKTVKALTETKYKNMKKEHDLLMKKEKSIKSSLNEKETKVYNKYFDKILKANNRFLGNILVEKEAESFKFPELKMSLKYKVNETLKDSIYELDCLILNKIPTNNEEVCSVINNWKEKWFPAIYAKAVTESPF